MINEMDIQRRMLISEIHSLQNENTHLKGKMTDCVPREQYEAAGCNIPQATHNAYIQDAETTIREFLQDAMAEEIKESRFTHNDETRLMVKCPDKKTGVVGYHNEYVHGI